VVWVHDSARSGSIGYVIGFTEGPAFTLTSRLYTNESGTIVTNEIVWWGSKCRGSAWNVRRSTPPFFGVCASAGRGARPSRAAPSASVAPPTLRASRRGSSGLGGALPLDGPPPDPRGGRGRGGR